MMPVGGVSLVTSIILAPFPNTQRMIFLVITFLAVYLRNFGMRWLSLGSGSFSKGLLYSDFGLARPIRRATIIRVYLENTRFNFIATGRLIGMLKAH